MSLLQVAAGACAVLLMLLFCWPKSDWSYGSDERYENFKAIGFFVVAGLTLASVFVLATQLMALVEAWSNMNLIIGAMSGCTASPCICGWSIRS